MRNSTAIGYVVTGALCAWMGAVIGAIGQDINFPTATDNIRVYADGQFIGTASSELLYNPGALELHFTTKEGVIDCRHNVIFRSRFDE